MVEYNVEVDSSMSSDEIFRKICEAAGFRISDEEMMDIKFNLEHGGYKIIEECGLGKVIYTIEINEE